MSTFRSDLSIDDAYSNADGLLHVVRTLCIAKAAEEAVDSDTAIFWCGLEDIIEQVIAHVEAIHRQAVAASKLEYCGASK